MEEVFEPVTTKQVESNEKQLQAIENKTRAIEHNNNTLQNSIKEGIKQYNEITNHNNQLLTSLVNSNQVDTSIVKTVSNLLIDKNKSQFSLEPIEGYPRSSTHSSANLFTINPHNPQQVLIIGSTMTFENGNSYNLNDPDLQYFIRNTQFDKPINKWGPIYSFLNDMKYDLNYGDEKSIRYQFIKELYSRYQLQGFAQDYTQAHDSQDQSQGFTGSGLHGESYRESYRERYREISQQNIFLPSDPDELVDQLKLLYFEKVGGNDNPQLNEQIIAIIDELLEYECISSSQHQNMRSNLITSKSPYLLKGSVCGLKIL